MKLELEPQDLERVRAHALLDGLGPARTLVSTYYDTPDLKLRGQGLSLRVRANGKGNVQTVKTAADRAGLLARGEWEAKLPSASPDPAATPDSPLEKALNGGVLASRFEVVVERRKRLVKRDGAEVELSLDAGEVRAGDKRVPIAELEFELKKGEPSALFRLAEPLFDAATPRLSARSKGETGYGLIAGAPTCFKSIPVELDRAMSTAEGFRAVGQACLVQFLRNERLVRKERQSDAVHQARVAMRRLRAAISIFKPLLGDPESERLKQGLKLTGASLGDARDLDVLIERMTALELTGNFDKAALVAELERRRTEAYDRAVEALASPATARLVFDVAAWLEAGQWSTTKGAPLAAARRRSLVDFASEDLARRSKKLRKAAPKIRQLEAPERHDVRIEAKKVRYAAEFFAPLADGADKRKAAKAFIAALKPFQEALGELNDLVNAERMLRVTAEASRDPNLAFAAGASVDEIERRTGPLLRAAEKAAADFEDAKPFLG